MNGSVKIIPMLLIVAVMAFSVRLTEVITGFSNLSSSTAYAAKPKEEKPDEKKEKMAKKDKEMEKDAKEVDGAEAPKWRDANDESTDITEVKLEIFNDLTERRKEIEKKEKNLQVREALLQAAEQEMDKKVTELNKLKKEIEALLGVKTEEEEKSIERLVKIYEGMKPANAAAVFNTLDIDVLIAVMTKMSERKVSPILSAMNPERARTVTIMMADQSKINILQ